MNENTFEKAGAVAFYWQLLTDLRKAINVNGWDRVHVKLLEGLILKAAPLYVDSPLAYIDGQMSAIINMHNALVDTPYQPLIDTTFQAGNLLKTLERLIREATLGAAGLELEEAAREAINKTLLTIGEVKERVSSFVMDWDEESQLWTVSIISGGKRYTDQRLNILTAIEGARNKAIAEYQTQQRINNLC